MQFLHLFKKLLLRFDLFQNFLKTELFLDSPKKYLTEDKVKDIDKKAREDVAKAAELAKEKDMPHNLELYKDVYRDLEI